MKTEMQQLKENAEQEKAKHHIKSVMQFYVDSFDETKEHMRWAIRAAGLTMVVVALWFPLLAWMAWLELPQDFINDIMGWYFNIFFVCVLREHHHDRNWKAAEGKLDGVHRTLVLLGWIEDDDAVGGRRRKKIRNRSYFSRYKELWERVKSGKSQEAYA